MRFGNSKFGPGTIQLLQGLGLSRRDVSDAGLAALERLVAERDAIAERLAIAEQLADRDTLAPVFNRRAFLRELHRTMSEVERYKSPAAVIYIDLDGFKALNDTYGHAAGDAVLSHAGRLLLDSVRESDVVGRLGGDEFGVILPVTSESAAVQVAERLRAAIEQIKLPQGLKLTTSIGIAGVTYCSERGETRTSVLSRADQALYRSKRAGGNRIAVDGVHHLFGA